jgi:hypothetical protein
MCRAARAAVPKAGGGRSRPLSRPRATALLKQGRGLLAQPCEPPLRRGASAPLPPPPRCTSRVPHALWRARLLRQHHRRQVHLRCRLDGRTMRHMGCARARTAPCPPFSTAGSQAGAATGPAHARACGPLAAGARRRGVTERRGGAEGTWRPRRPASRPQPFGPNLCPPPPRPFPPSNSTVRLSYACAECGKTRVSSARPRRQWNGAAGRVRACTVSAPRVHQIQGMPTAVLVPTYLPTLDLAVNSPSNSPSSCCCPHLAGAAALRQRRVGRVLGPRPVRVRARLGGRELHRADLRPAVQQGPRREVRPGLEREALVQVHARCME